MKNGGFELLAESWDCSKRTQIEAMAQSIDEEIETLVRQGYPVRLRQRISPSGHMCCRQPFEIVERSAGGEGITKWFEVIVFCPPLFHYHDNSSTAQNLSEGKLPPSLEGFYSVSRAISTAYSELRRRGHNADFRARVVWTDLGSYEILEEILVPINYIAERIIDERDSNTFAKYLCEFPEDSVENIAGNIWHSVQNLGWYVSDGKKTPLNFLIVDEFVKLGQLQERLVWKANFESSAAHGRKFDSIKNPRTAAATEANKIDRQRRENAIFEACQKMDLEQFRSVSSGRINAAKLARAVVESDPFKNTKSGMGAGAVANFLRENMAKIRGSKDI